MSGTWFCYNCDENIGDAEKCPYCGYSRNGVEDKYAPTLTDYAKARRILSGSKQNKKRRKSILRDPIYTDEEILALGLYPKDEGYKLSLITKILNKR